MKKSPQAIIVTGGGKGLGRAISQKLARSFCVLLVGRSQTELRQTCEIIRKSGSTADYYIGDVSVPETAENAVEKVRQLGWSLHGVICNAGVGKSSRTHELSLSQWHETFGTNIHGSFYFAKAALPVFLENKAGTLCFIGSTAGVRGFAYEAAYSASKHAVTGLAQSLALEYGKHGITSVAVCPSFIEGDMTTRTIKSVAARRGISEAEARKVVEKTNPQRRIIPEQEIAEMVDFICSGNVPSLAGSPIILSGGV